MATYYLLLATCYLGTLLPRYLFYGTNRYEKATSKIVASFMLPTAFAFGADILADFELNEQAEMPTLSDKAQPTSCFSQPHEDALTILLTTYDVSLHTTSHYIRLLTTHDFLLHTTSYYTRRLLFARASDRKTGTSRSIHS